MRRGLTPFALAAAAAAVILVVAGFLAVEAAAAAFLFVFVMALGISAGAVSVLLTGRLTGGAWFEALEPALLTIARTVPLIGLGFIPLMLLAPSLYPWAAEGAHESLVARYYLNWTFVIIRAIVAVGGWTVLAWIVAAAPRGTMQVAAGLGLVFHVIITTFLAFDWLMALQSGFTSSVFGAHIAILFLMAALCVATIASPPPAGKPTADTAGLVMAGTLGLVYIGFMQFLIIWYGDLAETAQFFLARAGSFGVGTIVLAVLAGALLPLAMLLPKSNRNDTARLRLAAACLLGGIALYVGWITLGLFGAAAVIAAALAVIAGGAAAVMLPAHHRRNRSTEVAQ